MLTELNGPTTPFSHIASICRVDKLACIAHKSLEICERCRLWQQNAPATPETTFALRATACPRTGKGRAIAKRRRNSAAFRSGEFKNSLFRYLYFKMGS